MSKFAVIKLPKSDPLIKLVPIMNAMGNFMVSSINKLTLLLFELFCIPIINNKNKHELNETVKTNFLNENIIFKS